MYNILGYQKEGHIFNQRSWLISFSKKHVNGHENTCDITYTWLQTPMFMTKDQQDWKNTNYQSPG